VDDLLGMDGRATRGAGPPRDGHASKRTVSASGRRGRLTILPAALLLGLGCGSQPPPAPDASAASHDPRSPRIKKRDELHPDRTPKKSPTAPGSRR
jgi:hypothetical protein